MRYIYIMIISFFVCACTPINDEQAQENVHHFHEMYQQQKYADIYSQASNTFKSMTTRNEFIDLLTVANNKDLGIYKKSTLKTKKEIHHIFDNNEVILIYVSEFSKRNVYETFLFEDVSGKMELKGYKYEALN